MLSKESPKKLLRSSNVHFVMYTDPTAHNFVPRKIYTQEAKNKSLEEVIISFYIQKRNQSVIHLQWLIQYFPEGAPTPDGAPTYNLTNFSQKLHENEEILAPRFANDLYQT